MHSDVSSVPLSVQCQCLFTGWRDALNAAAQMTWMGPGPAVDLTDTSGCPSLPEALIFGFSTTDPSMIANAAQNNPRRPGLARIGKAKAKSLRSTWRPTSTVVSRSRGCPDSLLRIISLPLLVVVGIWISCAISRSRVCCAPRCGRHSAGRALSIGASWCIIPAPALAVTRARRRCRGVGGDLGSPVAPGCHSCATVLPVNVCASVATGRVGPRGRVTGRSSSAALERLQRRLRMPIQQPERRASSRNTKRYFA